MSIRPGLTFRRTPRIGERLVRSGFFDLAVPMVGARAGSTADRLDLSLAGRYDSYSDVGGTFNPKIGLQLAAVGARQVARELGNLVPGAAIFLHAITTRWVTPNPGRCRSALWHRVHTRTPALWPGAGS